MSSQDPVIFPLWAFADSKTGMKMRPLDPALLLLREGESAKLSSSYIERSEKRKLRGLKSMPFFLKRDLLTSELCKILKNQPKDLQKRRAKPPTVSQCLANQGEGPQSTGRRRSPKKG